MGKNMTLTPLPPNQTQKPETGRVVHKESALLVNRGRVERAFTKKKPVFAVLMLEYTSNPDTSALQPSIPPLIEEFQDVLSPDLPPGLPPKRGIEHQIDLLPGAPLPNKPAYRCNPTETKEMQRKVSKLSLIHI